MLEPRLVLDSTVVFNEIMYNPAGADESLEFIELHNQMAVDVDISAWQLSEGVDFTFAEETIVPGGGYVVIAKDPAALFGATGVSALGPYAGQLSNGGERLLLTDRSARVMDSLSYSDDNRWPVAPDGTGVSLAKKDPDSASDLAENWTTSVAIGGTPGAPNMTESENSTALLAINETAPATDAEFWFELVNHGTVPVDLIGYVVATTDGGLHALTGPTLAPGQYLVITETELGFGTSSGDRIYLITPDGSSVVDAANITDNLQGRSPDGTGPFQIPDVATPGSVNSFSLHDQIVINEIMYHHLPDPGTPGSPGIPPKEPTYDTTELLGLGDVWRYSDTGEALPAGWQTTAHAVGGNWSQGAGLIGYETGVVPAPGLNTTLANPQAVPPGSFVTTYYFEREFSLTAQQLADLDELQLRYVIDDGAVFYINGHEVGPRVNMLAGAINSATFAEDGPADATLSEIISISSADLLVGSNRFSVEVHQVSSGSSDVMFGVQLLAAVQTSPGDPGTPEVPASNITENPEEWIELYNRSATTIDLSGWQLDEAVNYVFPFGTLMAPGEYLVIANNAAVLAAKYPYIRVLGDFSGKLSNQDERIVLLDAVGNLADEVHYYENGRWPEAADGQGSSLELRDPDADNSVGEAWSASDESNDSGWETYVYSGVASASSVGPDGAWQEFVLGLLDSGEMLLDDISVIESPGTARAFQLISNGSFESDALGGPANDWRTIGNHRHSEVIVDPDDLTNHALRLVATGPTEHMHNHAETTLAGGSSIQNGIEYQISFRAKWISGSNQINTRLYFNRLARTTLITRSADNGTPGWQNTAYEVNIGPTYREFIHGPAVPSPGEPVLVTTFADDPNDVAMMTLWYAVNDGAWKSVAMTLGAGGLYSALIPGQSAKAIVQFYVEGIDGLGAISTFPRAGRDSRALFRVDGGEASGSGINNLRIVVTPADANFLHSTINLMSNDLVGTTLIYNEHEIFYDAGVRLSGSERARPVTARLGFIVRFNADHLFRGVHSGLTLDRSDSTGFGQREILLHTAMGHAGGLPAEYNDLVNIITPRDEHTGGAEMQMARYSDVFLDSQYENGGDGRLFEYELVYYPTQANLQGYKFPEPDNVVGTNIRNLGDEPEDYRWTFLIKNNRAEDDYHRIIEWAKVMGKSGAAFNDQISSVIDVDQYLRAMAFAASSGFGDNYAAGSQHNAQFYVRPEDNRVLYFPHDLDAFFNSTSSLLSSGDLQKILSASPANRHVYYGHVYDIVTNSYNTSYMQHWADNYQSLLPNQNWSSWLVDIGSRASNVLAQVNSAIPPIPFAISTNGGADLIVNDSVATLTGNGWVNVRDIYIAGNEWPLEVQWINNNTWTTTVPLQFGANPITLQAVDYRGNLVATDAINITSTFADHSLQDYLRVSELNYHPAPHAGVADQENLEFIELVNTGTSTLDLSGVQIADFASTPYVFASGTMLQGGERIAVARNPAVLQSVYGTNFPLAAAGYGTSNFSNSGETISLRTATGEVIVSFTYSDDPPWPTSPDGDGYSLEIIDPTADPNNAANWRASSVLGGTPGLSSLQNTPGDFDGDADVDGLDFLAWQRGLGITSGAQTSDGDADGNGTVDGTDLSIWRTNYGATAPLEVIAAVLSDDDSHEKTTLAASLVVTPGMFGAIQPVSIRRTSLLDKDSFAVWSSQEIVSNTVSRPATLPATAKNRAYYSDRSLHRTLVIEAVYSQSVLL